MAAGFRGPAAPGQAIRPACAPTPQGHNRSMQTFLTLLVGAAMLLTLGVLVAGLVAMARGSSSETSQKLMRYRVVFQGVALLLFGVLMMLLR